MRKAANLTQDDLATHAGLSPMTVQRAEAGQIDPRLSSVQAIAKTLNVELMLVPTALRHELESFVRSGGRFWDNQPVQVRRCRLFRHWSGEKADCAITATLIFDWSGSSSAVYLL